MGFPNTTPNHKTADLTELVGTQLFKQVSMAQVSALLRFCPTLTLANGDRLIVPGQTIEKIHLLLQGRLKVFDGEPTGEPVGQIQQGECVGLSSFVDRQPCHVSIVSDGISRLLVLDEERLTALINTPTTVSRNLLFLLMAYLRSKAARAQEPAAPAASTAQTHNHIDAVTGLHNQGWLDETLDRLIMRAATDSAPLSLLAVDLLDLPGLTAQYEQELINLSLHEIAKTLSASIRPTDLIARHATGRFIIMLPGADQENTEMVAARVQEIVNNADIVIPGVCVLPPMKVVMGGIRMGAFVSSRKLVDDAFAKLELNRVVMLTPIIEPVTEATVEPEQPVADVCDIAAPELESQSIEATAEPSPAAPDTTAPEVAAETLAQDTYSASIDLEPVAVIQPEDLFNNNGAVPPDVSPSESPESPQLAV